MNYPNIPDYNELISNIIDYSKLKSEYGAKGIDSMLADVENTLKKDLAKIKELHVDEKMAAKEPDTLKDIRMLRPAGPRRMWKSFDKEKYTEKVEGALLARMAGCILGAAVEGWPVATIKAWADYLKDQFPPVDYWSGIKDPSELWYKKSLRVKFTRDAMDGVPTDDDIAYTLIGLLIAEEYGVDFTTADVGKAWVKYLPYACTAEKAALDNLRQGISADKAADINNPYCQWIGADIRSDPWAYMSPGCPEKAAQMAYRDAYLSHRRNGIYGEMFFSAAQAAAFDVDNPIDAIKIGLTEIPSECALADAVRWALDAGKNIHDYRDARAAVDEKFKGMHPVHTINNACLTIFGLMIGGCDVTKVLSEIVAMGMDNDCTAATAGSIVGAIVGKKGVPEHWYKNFNNTVYSYMTGKEEFKIDDLVRRFAVQAEKNLK